MAVTTNFDGLDITFRLTADHWVYPVIAARFEPWAGGDEAPADWDGGEVLSRNGSRSTAPASWTHPWHGGTEPSSFDVIGYRKRVEPGISIYNPYAEWDHPSWVRNRTVELAEQTGVLRKALLDHVQTHETDPTETRAEELFTVAYGAGWAHAAPATQEVWRRVARHVS